MTVSDFSIAFMFGAVGSVHCVQMCGPIVLAGSMHSPGILPQIAYNAGRILTYSLLGAVAGAAGDAMGLLGGLAGIEKAAMVVSGTLMILAGIFMLGVVPSSGLVSIGATGLYHKTVGRLLKSHGLAGRTGLGMLLGFLPCGLLYAALLKAFGTSSVADGALTMAAFGAGTAGALLGLGAFSSAITTRLGRWSNVLAAAGVILVGAILVWKGYMAQPHRMMGQQHHGHS